MPGIPSLSFHVLFKLFWIWRNESFSFVLLGFWLVICFGTWEMTSDCPSESYVLKIMAWDFKKKGLVFQVVWFFSCFQMFNNFVVVFPSSLVFSAPWIKCDLVGEWALSCFPLLNSSHDDRGYLNNCKSFILFLIASQASFSQALQDAPAGMMMSLPRQPGIPGEWSSIHLRDSTHAEHRICYA